MDSESYSIFFPSLSYVPENHAKRTCGWGMETFHEKLGDKGTKTGAGESQSTFY